MKYKSLILTNKKFWIELDKLENKGWIRISPIEKDTFGFTTTYTVELKKIKK